VPGGILRYVTDAASDDTGGAAYLNNFQGTAWLEDEFGVRKYDTMWPLFPPLDSLLAVLQYERRSLFLLGDPDYRYLQYWSYDSSSNPNPNRFADETLHPKREQSEWPPVWDNDIPLP
jgi:hypothetical protein